MGKPESEQSEKNGDLDRLPHLLQEILAFRDARDWAQYHTPKDLASGITIEAGELLECFLWKTPEQVESALQDPQFREHLGEEIADVAIYTLLLAHGAGMNLGELIRQKLILNSKKYPVELARGKSTKSAELLREAAQNQNT
jgi:NTP pyrophosphatase (non-canonical NTP hydrolase)